TETQLKLVAPKFAKKVIFALDADAAGQSATSRSIEVVRKNLGNLLGKIDRKFMYVIGVDIRVIEIPDAKDPDDLIRSSPETWQKLVDTAVSIVDYLIDKATTNLSPDASLVEREEIARDLLPILIGSRDNSKSKQPEYEILNAYN